MRDFIETLGIMFLTLIAILLVGFGLSYLGYRTYEYLAPRYVAVDSKVFKESVQYNEGMVRDLSELERQYKQSDADGKAALDRKSTRLNSSHTDISRMPSSA